MSPTTESATGHESSWRAWGWYYDALSAARFRPGEHDFHANLAAAARGVVAEPACGAGRVLAIAKGLGREVWGADAEGAMLTLAERRLATLRPDVPHHLVRQGLADFDPPERLGLVLLPLDAVRLTADRRELAALMATVAARLAAGGCLALDMDLPDAPRRDSGWLPSQPHPDGGRTRARVRQKLDGGFVVEETVYRTTGDDGRVTEAWTEDRYRQVTLSELESALQAADMAVTQRCVDFLGTPWRPGDTTLVLTARR
jgi:SAM-dependent methyltransferase